ncbi:MAG: GtrA family protein [Micropruina sp.]|nr:MAG: GtrA family protein [Micropruina sp.]
MFRFVVTGGLSAIVDYGLLVVGMNLGGLDHTPAKALSWLAGTVTAYLINSRWTFQAEHSHKRFLAVAALYAATFALQVGTFALIYPPLQAAWGTTVAQFVGFVIAQGLATTLNFIAQRTLIFRD